MLRTALRRLAALAAPACLACAAHAADCPQGVVTLAGAQAGPTAAAVYDTSGYGGSGGWDMIAGSVHMYSSGTLSGATTDAFDDYDVTGVPPGTVVNLVAALTVDGAVWTDGCGGTGCGGYYWVHIIHGTDSLSVEHADHLFSGRLDHTDVILLPLTITAGQPERLEIRAHGARSPGGSHYSEATSVVSFRGLDGGTGITSCKGFAGAVVPVRTNSWGRIKTMYR